MVEQLTLNQLVGSSNLPRGTTSKPAIPQGIAGFLSSQRDQRDQRDAGPDFGGMKKHQVYRRCTGGVKRIVGSMDSWICGVQRHAGVGWSAMGTGGRGHNAPSVRCHNKRFQVSRMSIFVV